ncbi:MAG: hypothetical protein EXR58_06135 [Chloroflexi bacterium]|nr:hypothetical protein [Chloroflexota bacterium]
MFQSSDTWRSGVATPSIYPIRLGVIYPDQSDTLQIMAEQVGDGARGVGGTQVRLVPLPNSDENLQDADPA